MIVLFWGIVIFLSLLMIIYFFCSSIFNKQVSLNSTWVSVYECGCISHCLGLNFFSITYFSLLVFFVVFDLEISLLLNMPEQGLLYDNFLYYYFFLLALSLGYIIEVILGYVRWGY